MSSQTLHSTQHVHPDYMLSESLTWNSSSLVFFWAGGCGVVAGTEYFYRNSLRALYENIVIYPSTILLNYSLHGIFDVRTYIAEIAGFQNDAIFCAGCLIVLLSVSNVQRLEVLPWKRIIAKNRGMLSQKFKAHRIIAHLRIIRVYISKRNKSFLGSSEDVASAACFLIKLVEKIIRNSSLSKSYIEREYNQSCCSLFSIKISLKS